jgi:hypothetical protein
MVIKKIKTKFDRWKKSTRDEIDKKKTPQFYKLF